MDGSTTSVLHKPLRLSSIRHQITKVHGLPLHALLGVSGEKRCRSLIAGALSLAMLAGGGNKGGAAIRPLPDGGDGVEGAG